MSMADDIRDLRNQVFELSNTVAGGLENFRTIAQHHQKLLDKLTKITLDGNGGDSLLTEVKVIKDQLTHGVKSFSIINERIDKLEKKINEKTIAETTGKWKVIAALITGLLALGAAIF